MNWLPPAVARWLALHGGAAYVRIASTACHRHAADGRTLAMVVTRRPNENSRPVPEFHFDVAAARVRPVVVEINHLLHARHDPWGGQLRESQPVRWTRRQIISTADRLPRYPSGNRSARPKARAVSRRCSPIGRSRRTSRTDHADRARCGYPHRTGEHLFSMGADLLGAHCVSFINHTKDPENVYSNCRRVLRGCHHLVPRRTRRAHSFGRTGSTRRDSCRRVGDDLLRCTAGIGQPQLVLLTKPYSV